MPTFSISSNGNVTAGNNALFTVSMSGTITAPYTIWYSTLAGTASAADGDYPSTYVNQALTFNPGGPTTQTISIPTLTNSTSSTEGNETFSVGLQSTQTGNPYTSASITILPNSAPAPTFSISSAGTVTAGNNAAFTVTMSGTITSPYTIWYSTLAGTASAADGDYPSTYVNQALTFNPGGPTTQTISIPTLTNSTSSTEGNETFSVGLQSTWTGNPYTSASITILPNAAQLEPTLSSVSPNPVPASNSAQTIKLYGSNFVSGDSLYFTYPGGSTNNLSPISVVSPSEIDYDFFNDMSGSGGWTVQVRSPDGTLSNAESFSVASSGGNAILGIDTANDTTLASQASTLYTEGYRFFGAYVGPLRTFNSTEASEIESAKLSIVSIHERTSGGQIYSIADANTDAADAIKYAYQSGQPLNTSSQHSAIYFALELNSGQTPVSDAAAIQYLTQLSADFASTSFVSNVLGFSTAANPYDIGIYASNSNLAAVHSLGLSNLDFYWRDTNLPNDPQSEVTTFSSPNIQRDLNGSTYDTNTALTSDYGQWGVNTSNDTISETVPSSTVTVSAGVTTAISGVSISDAGGANDTFTTVVSDYSGTLTASGAGVTGSGTSIVTITGSLSTINSALSALAYTAGNGASDTVTVTTSDPNASNSPASKSFGVTINSPDDAVSETAPAMLSANAARRRRSPACRSSTTASTARPSPPSSPPTQASSQPREREFPAPAPTASASMARSRRSTRRSPPQLFEHQRGQRQHRRYHKRHGRSDFGAEAHRRNGQSVDHHSRLFPRQSSRARRYAWRVLDYRHGGQCRGGNSTS